MPDNYANFEPGKVICALYKTRSWDDVGTLYDDIMQEIEYEKVEVIFPSKETESKIGEIVLVHLTCQKPSTVITAVGQLTVSPHVYHAEPNFLFNRHIIPNDPYYKDLWGLEAIKAPLAWDYTTGSAGIAVGVVDSGIDHNHPDIKGNMWPSHSEQHGWNFVGNNSDTTDTTGHGTHVAGTVGAVGDNAIGITGVCWNVKVASLKIGDTFFSLAAAIASIHFANTNNIPILNNSWGGRFNSPSLEHAIEHYNGLYVASAGNEGVNSDYSPDYPASFDLDNIISVAATNQDGTLTAFSNYGVKSVDIAAPGIDILSLSLQGGYSNQLGTSMAAPHVAGAAALLKSYKPGLTALEIKDIILSSVDKYPNLEGKLLSGGILNVGAMFALFGRRVSPADSYNSTK